MKKLGLLALILFMSACQSGETGQDTPSTEDAAQLEEKPTFVIQTDGKDIAAETVEECWVENCSEESSSNQESESITETTEDFAATTVTSGDEVQVKVEGEEPDRLSYRMQEGGHVESKTIEGDSFEVYGEGEQHFLIDAEWMTENGSFQGSKTIGLVINVDKEEGKEVKEAVLKETTFTSQGDSYPAAYHVTCLNVTACEAPPTNSIDSYKEWKEEVDPAKIPADIGEEVTINFPEGMPVPDRLNIQKQQGATGKGETMENNTIEIMGEEGKDIIYIVRAEWSEEEMKTAGVQFVFIVPAPVIS